MQEEKDNEQGQAPSVSSLENLHIPILAPQGRHLRF